MFIASSEICDLTGANGAWPPNVMLAIQFASLAGCEQDVLRNMAGEELAFERVDFMRVRPGSMRVVRRARRVDQRAQQEYECRGTAQSSG
jgi:hypothetical protein